MLPQKRIEVLYIHSLLGQVTQPFPPSWVTLDHVTPPGPEDRAVVPIAGTQALTETQNYCVPGCAGILRPSALRPPQILSGNAAQHSSF